MRAWQEAFCLISFPPLSFYCQPCTGVFPALNALSWRAWNNILAKEFCFRWEILFHIDIIFPQQQMAANKDFKLQEDFLPPSFEQLGYLTSQFLKTKTQITTWLEG